ncbi:sulfatase-like hydrolase/transferase, partial [bacterium]|nr:sulfatase-like hydrolase/transferase [bacterium]
MTSAMRLVLSLIVSGLLLATGATTGWAADRPNVIFILADDLGWADLGCYGSTFYETPNLDSLARQGMRFTDAYAAGNVCSPTRASILTGKHPARLHLTDWLNGRPNRPDQKLNRADFQMFLPPDEVTLAEALKDGGYQTAFIGKWHLGESTSYWPEHQGFDLNIGGCGSGRPQSYFSPYGIPNLPDGPKGEYLNDRLTDEALKFLDRAAQQKKPFLLYFSDYAVHTPLQAKPETIEKYKAKAAKLAKSGPEFLTDHGRPVRQIQDHPVYGAMVENMDDSVGRVMAKLKELKLDTNTIVIFTSDNGGLSTAEGTPTSNLPLRTGKGWGYEGGVREPLIVRWPGVTLPGSVNHGQTISTDYYPTILQMLGLPLRPAQHLDGESIVPLLKGAKLPERPLFWHYPHYSNQGSPPHGAVRVGDFKLIEWYEDMNVELYDLKNDLGEQHDLANENPAKAAELASRLHDWRQQVDAQMPTPNPDYRPGAKTIPADAWENPLVFEVNRMPPRSMTWPHPSAKSAAAAPGASRDSPWLRCISGEWKFNWMNEPAKSPAGFEAPNFDDRTWKTIPVPGCVELFGHGTPLYVNYVYPFKVDPPRVMGDPPADWTFFTDRNPVSSYRRWVEVPMDWTKQRVYLHVGAAGSCLKVWVNGQCVGYSEDSRLAAEFDISSAVHPGRNLIAFQVLRHSDASYLEDQDIWRLSGIFRDVFLFTRPNVHLWDVAVESELDNSQSQAVAKLRCQIRNDSEAPADSLAVRLTLRDPSGKVVSGFKIVSPVTKALAAGQEIELLTPPSKVDSPHQWSFEDPALYTAVV